MIYLYNTLQAIKYTRIKLSRRLMVTEYGDSKPTFVVAIDSNKDFEGHFEYKQIADPIKIQQQLHLCDFKRIQVVKYIGHFQRFKI